MRAIQAVLERAEKLFEWRVPSDPILDIALDHLTLGRTHLHLHLAAEVSQPAPTHLAQATDHLDRAVDGLRQSGNLDDLPRGLLARAILHRWTNQPNKATADLDEAFEIAERGEMRLHLTDAHLERARLRVHLDEMDAARRLVEETGYHRRDREVAELDAILQEA